MFFFLFLLHQASAALTQALFFDGIHKWELKTVPKPLTDEAFTYDPVKKTTLIYVDGPFNLERLKKAKEEGKVELYQRLFAQLDENSWLSQSTRQRPTSPN